MRASLATALSVLLLAGCALGGGSPGNEGIAGQGAAVAEPAPDESAPDEPAPGGDDLDAHAPMGDELVPTIVTPTPGMVDVAPIGWVGAQPVDDRDDAVVVAWWSGVEPCAVLDHYTVLESDEQVEVTLFQGRQPDEDGGDQPCPDIARYTGVVIDLDAPLGTRVVVDGTGS